MAKNYFAIPHQEGFWEIEDYELYYRAFGDGDTVLLGLHGGPGFASPYLAPLAQHGSDEVTVYLYDQFGCGHSDRPAAGDVDRYTVEHYREEVERVRQRVGAEQVILYGSSWGSALAQEYVLQYPKHVEKLIMSGALHDMKRAKAAMRAAMREELTDEEMARVEELEARHAFDNPAYQELVDKVAAARVLRLDETPVWFRQSEKISNNTLKAVMEGVNEFMLSDTARLRDWSTADRLPEIETPTLIISGEYDEISPEIAREMADLMPNARIEVLEGASHVPFWERPERHYQLVEDFIQSS